MKRQSQFACRALVALFLATPFAAQSAEMYYNRLSTGDAIIPAGTYGDIVVPAGGYKATQFPSALGTISQATGDYGGAYAKIITTVNKNNDLMDHTISGWFKVPTKSGETTLCVEKTSSSYANSRGNAIRVSAAGNLLIGKVKSTDAWQDSGTHITSTGTVPINQWFYLTVAITVDHTARTAIAKAYVNGVEFEMPETAFACNYNGSSCAALKVGDNVECAGLRVDDAVIADTATMKAWATGERYVVRISELTYAMPYVSMGYRITDDATGTFLTHESQLAFPGCSLEDVLAHDFFGRLTGANYSGSGTAYEGGLRPDFHKVSWTNEQGKLEKVLFSVNGHWRGTSGYYVKVVTVLLTNGVDGVYAVVPANGARNYKGSPEDRQFASFNTDGTIELIGNAKMLATSDDMSDYGCRGLTMTRYIPSDKPVLAFADTTVDAIKHHTFTGYSTGRKFSTVYTSISMASYNEKVTEESEGIATKLRAEMQVIDDGFLKCVVVEFTNGNGGVYVKALAARYLEGGALGYKFAKDGGGYNGSSQTIARDFSVAGYGVFALKAYAPPAITTACWTGVVGDGDIANAANWACTNAAREEVSGALPTADTSVYFTGDAINAQITNAVDWAAVNANGKLGTNCDWAGLGTTPIAEGSSIDVNGHNLTLANVFKGTVTDTTTDITKPGSLTLDVAENTTLENETLSIQGNLKFVKEGEGTFVSRLKNQNYTGGTVVNAGTIKSIGYEMYFYYGADATPFTINAGGILDINGQYSWYRHHICMNGGEIRNSNGNQTTYGNNAFGNITLTADSTMLLKCHTLVNYADTSIDLGGHTLTVTHDSGTDNALLTFNNTKVFNGTIDLGQDIRFYPYGTTPDFTDATVVMRGSCRLTGDQVFSNLVSSLDKKDTQADTAKKITVTGAFKPVSKYLHNTLLANGATLDLTEKTEPFDINESLIANQAITFESGATITVDIHGRALAKGFQLVAWDAPPDGVTFQWDAITVAGSPETLTVTDEGIFYGVSDVADAYWTNAAGDGDVDNWQNWACTNSSGAAVAKGLPSSLSTIHLPYYVNFSVPAGKSIACAKIQFKSTAILSADCDWRGLGVVTVAGNLLHLQGHTLTTAGLGTVEDAELKIVNAAETFSQLVFDIPSGQTYENDHIAILQNIQFVKQGAGTFVAKKSGQNYTGGTVVAEGTVKTGIQGTTGPFGEGTVANPKPITVESGATFNLNGQVSHTVYRFILNGGTLTNTASDMGKTTGFGSLTLGADSPLAATRSVSGWCGHTIDLGGHTLNVAIGDGKYLYLSGDASGEPVTYKAGKIVVSSGGWLNFYKGKVNARNVDFDVNAALKVEVDVDVRDYTSRYGQNYNNGTAALNVFGTFKPVSSYWYGCTMQGGSTIDLSERTGAWPLTSAFTGGEKTVKFADGALVWVNLGTRTDLKKGDKIIAWAAKPNASIKVIPETMGAVMKDDGLYLGIEEGVPVADASGKGTVTIPTEWVAAHATGETPEDRYASLTAPRETGNKITLRDNYVLGLEPEVETSVPVLLPAQAGDEGIVILRVGGLDVHPESGAVVKYQMMEKDGTQAEFVAGTVQAEDVFEAGLPASGVKYYKVNVIVTTPEAGEEETVAQVLVNGKAYTSLAAAVADAEEGDMLVVMDDLSTAGTINVPKSMTLDLNELSVEGTLNVKSGATLTVVGVGEFDGPINVEDGGTLDWKNGTHKE